jgi:protoporphyrinogen oxidase
LGAGFAGDCILSHQRQKSPENGVVTPDADVLVVGAGPAGLTAAYCLTRKVPSVIVIEKDTAYVGGMSRTIRNKDFHFDIGGARFSASDPEVAGLWQEILPDALIERPWRTQIFYRGKYHSYPLSAADALRNLGMISRAACMMSYGLARLRPTSEPNSFHHWARNEYGEKLFRIFLKTYAEKVWGMSCDEISSDWASRSIRSLGLGLAVRNSPRPSVRQRLAKRAGQTARTGVPAETISYPRDGCGAMWDTAAQKISERGGRVLLGRKLQSLSYDNARELWQVKVSTVQGVETHTARHVVSSAPVCELLDSLSPRPISQFHAQALRYRDFITVALMVKNSDVPEGSIYIHDPSVKAGRVQCFKSGAAGMTPPQMRYFNLEYFCFEGDSVWNMPDENLISLARSEIVQLGLVAADEVADACVVRQPKAFPIHDDDARHNMAMIRLDLETHYPTLHLIGRNGMHKDNDLEQAMMTAIMTARNIEAGARIHDVWSLNEDAVNEETVPPDADDIRAA